MKYFDIRRTKKQKPFQLHAQNVNFSAYQSETVQIKAEPQIQAAAEKLKAQYYQYSSVKVKLKRRFTKSYALFAFTFFVLGFGIFLGARFVSFANSISTSRTSFYKTVTNNIGAVFGPFIPALSSLDDSKVGEAIRNKEKINVLLLGYGGTGHSGSYLTDTLMLVNIDFSTNKVTFIPVPRDIWIKIPTRGYDGNFAKINSAYALGRDQVNYPNKLPQFNGVNGGGELAKYVVEQVTGIKADYYVSMDFAGFKEVVDALGGVSINVDNTFTDYTYPSGEANVNAPSCIAEDIPDSLITECRYKKLHFEKGEQFMDGSRALEYVRSRHASGVEGSDYARSKRQQKLIAAIEQKAISLGALPKIFSVMDSIRGHFKTDLSFAEIKDLSNYVSDSEDQNIQSIVISESGLLISSKSADGQWILVPAQGLKPQTIDPDPLGPSPVPIAYSSNWSSIHKYISNVLAGLAQPSHN